MALPSLVVVVAEVALPQSSDFASGGGACLPLGAEVKGVSEEEV